MRSQDIWVTVDGPTIGGTMNDGTGVLLVFLQVLFNGTYNLLLSLERVRRLCGNVCGFCGFHRTKVFRVVHTSVELLTESKIEIIIFYLLLLISIRSRYSVCYYLTIINNKIFFYHLKGFTFLYNKIALEPQYFFL